MIGKENIDNSDFQWDRLLSLIKRKEVIPVIGQGLYRVDVDAEGKHNVLLYDYLAEQLLTTCGADLHPDETHKFAKACFEFLKNSRNDYLELSYFLKMTFKKIRLITGSPLWKLARIKSFNFFITTVYDEFLTNILNSVRNIPTKSFSYTQYEGNFAMLNKKVFESLEKSKCALV